MLLKNKKIIIAIDGFSSCGKSTMAKQIATQLGYVFIDSGAMYRAIALYFLQNKIDINNETAINKALQQIHLSFNFISAEGKSHIILNGVDVENDIRSMEVNNAVSPVAALPAVRTFAVAQQQKMGEQKGIVMDGRDIGTTVFPNAELKIFVTADVNIRTERRFKELQEKNIAANFEEVKQNLIERDTIDSTRAVSPLTQAKDAVVLDNSHLTKDQQLQLVLQWVNQKIG